MPKTIKASEFFKGLAESIDAAKKPAVAKLLEDMDAPTGDVMMSDEPAADAGDHKADLLAAVAKLIDDGSEEAQADVKKIMAILMPKPEKAETPATEEDDKPMADDKPKDDEKKDAEEQVKRRESVLDLCESLEFQPSKVQRKALIALSEDADRKELVESFKAGKAPAKGNGVSDKPRSRLAGALTESKNGKGKVTDYDSFFARVMN